MVGKCQNCGGELPVLIDFGPQPVCNRYLSGPDAGEFRFPMILSQCPRDGLLQLGQPWPSDEVRPRLDWISYKEPERHLDDMASRISKLPGVGNGTLVVGLSYKDEPVLTRLESLGFRNVWNVPLEELGIKIPGAGMESIQNVLTDQLGRKLREQRGAPGVIVVRHLLEHSNSVPQILSALKAWAGPGAYFVFEVPDSEQTFRDLDFGTVWEEHVCYFTEFTLGRVFEPHGIDLIETVRYPYTLEDCLVAFVANRAPRGLPGMSSERLERELALGRRFRDGMDELASRCRQELEANQTKGGKAVIFGAGHRAATFVNLLGLESFLSCVIDDDPRKAGLHLPGSQLPILPSAYLLAERPALCLLAASPDSEGVIRQRNQAYLDAGGTMVSIYPRSPLAWRPLAAGDGAGGAR